MATDTERLVIELSANLKNFENNWRRANGLIAKNTRLMEKSFGGAERAARNAAAAIIAAFGVREIANLTDQYTRFTNQLRIAGFEGGRLAATQEDLFGIAQQYGVALEDLGTLFGRTSQSANELGASQADLRKFVEGTAAAMRVQGGDVSTARGALIQLSQALGGTTVRAEEFNSMQEGLRPLVIAAANGIDRMGGSFARLRAEVIAGNVSSREFFEGLLKGYDKTIEQAKTAQLTIAQSFTVLSNALSKYLGETNTAVGATAVLADAIKLLADNLELVGNAVLVISLGLGVGFVRNALLAAAAANGAGAAMLTAFGGPIGIAITAVVLAIGSLTMGMQALNEVSGEQRRYLESGVKAVTDYETAVETLAKAEGEARKAAQDLVNVRRHDLEQMRDATKATLTLTRAKLAMLEADAQTQMLSNQPSFNETGGAERAFAESSRINRLSSFADGLNNTLNEIEASLSANGRRDAALNRAVGGTAGGGAGDAPSAAELEKNRLLKVALAAEEAITEAKTEQGEIQEKFNDALADGIQRSLEGIADQKDAALDAIAEQKEANLEAIKAEAEARKEALLKGSEYIDDLRQRQYDATYSGVSEALGALADGDALQYLGKRLKQMALDNLAVGITEGLMGSAGGTIGSFVGSLFGVPRHAAGTNYAPGGLSLVGERGPELLNIPRGSQVTPNHKIGGKSMSLTFAPTINLANGGPSEMAALRAEMGRQRRALTSEVLSKVPAFLDQHDRYRGA